MMASYSRGAHLTQDKTSEVTQISASETKNSKFLISK